MTELIKIDRTKLLDEINELVDGIIAKNMSIANIDTELAPEEYKLRALSRLTAIELFREFKMELEKEVKDVRLTPRVVRK